MLTIIILLIIVLGVGSYYYLAQKDEKISVAPSSENSAPVITPEPEAPTETKPQERPEELPKI
jgi:hypothetical protein